MRYSHGIVAATVAVALLALTPMQQAGAHRHHQDPPDASVVSEWNQIGLAALAADSAVPPGRKQPIETYLYLAFMHTAMYNAVVGIEGRYQPYRFRERAPRHASPQAAAVAAAHRVLVTYSPEQQATLDAAYARSLDAIPDGAAERKGVAYGELAASTLVEQRAHDGRNGTTVFDLAPAVGVWRPTPPAELPFSAPWLGHVTPLMLRSGDQLDPGPAPALTSSRYTRDFAEVKAFGKDDSTDRTVEQTETAMFYAGNPGLQFNLGLVDQAQKRGLDLVDAARLFAAVEASLADASIAIWWTKQHYGVWRPITAIREADQDGNPATVADPSWSSLIPSPPYPDYVSGYNGVMGAYTQALQDTLGTRHLALTLTTTVFPAPDPRHTRSYDTGREVRQEVIDGRVWLGIHFRFADTAAAWLGRQVADYGLARNFRPLP